MSAANVVSLQGARGDRDARINQRIVDAVAKLGADMEVWGSALIEWMFMPGEQRGAVADALASEIVTRYAPIAKQFRTLYDVVELYVAGAQERGEDLGMAVLLALTVQMGDERYIEIAKHIAREQIIKSSGVNEVGAGEMRRKSPSCVDEARDRLFDHYAGLRKK